MKNQSETPALDAEKLTGASPEHTFDYIPKSPQTGYESIYGSTQRTSGPRPRLGWCEDSYRNSPQLYSLVAATLIFSSGGMNLVSSIGFGPLNLYGTHIQFSWFIAVIIGACISTILVHKISKRVFNLVSSVLVIISGIFLIVSTQSSSAVLLARYCDGTAFGLTLIPAIVAGSEQSVKRFRGLVLSVEHFGLLGGALLKMIYSQHWGNNDQQSLKPDNVHGVLTLIYGVLALVFTFILTLESPVFLLRKDNEDEAVYACQMLQRPKTITNDTYALLNESRDLLEEDMSRESSKNISNSWIPMIKMIIFRCSVSMSFSFPLTLTFLLATSSSSRSGIPMALYIYVLMRLIGVIFSVFFLDTLGRRIPSAISLLLGGAVLFGVGCLASTFWSSYNAYTQPAIFLMLIYQMISGITGPASTCYLGEAFSVSVKPLFILAAVISENVLQIVACCLASRNLITSFACTLGGLQVFYAIVFFLTMPETMQTTLREALKKFQTIFVVRLQPEEEDGTAV